MFKSELEILVVDDHQLFLEGLRLALSAMEGAPKITTCNSATEALQKVSNGQDFDLILLDLNMPEVNGIEFLHKLGDMQVWIPVLILSAASEYEMFQQAMAAGAGGFVAKSASTNELATALTTVLSGDTYLPDTAIFDTATDANPANHELAEELGLTPRQLEVIQLLAEGLPNKLICDKLDISEHTIKKHISAILQKLNVRNRTACVLEAARLGLVEKKY